jgi:hypothetical protein
LSGILIFSKIGFYIFRNLEFLKNVVNRILLLKISKQEMIFLTFFCRDKFQKHRSGKKSIQHSLYALKND